MPLYSIPSVIHRAHLKGPVRCNASVYITGPFQAATAGQIDGTPTLGDSSADFLRFYGIAAGATQAALLADSATVIETNTARIASLIDVFQNVGLMATA